MIDNLTLILDKRPSRCLNIATYRSFFYIGGEHTKSEMKIGVIFLVFMGTLWLGTTELRAQNTTVESKNELGLEEEDGPLMYRFEPDYLTSLEQRKARILKMRAILDTLDIREGKRKRLLKDLYKNGVSERLSKALLTDTDFDDIADIIN